MTIAYADSCEPINFWQSADSTHRKYAISPFYDDQSWDEDHDACAYEGKDFEVSLASVLYRVLPSFPLLAMDAGVLGGTPRVAGTRIPVSMILDAVQYYGNIDGAIESYPDLVPEQVKQALSFASAIMERSVELEFTNSFG